MKKTLFLFSLLPLLANAQNLVPNPGFEEYKQLPCACMQSDIEDYIMDWNSAGTGTPDIIYDYPEVSNDCYASAYSTSSISFGTQKPHSGHGHGMVMTTAHGDSYREYLGVTLKTPLVKGKKYYAEMWVSLGDKCKIATNNVGIGFFTGAFVRSSNAIIEGTPLINQNTVISDASGWTKISGTFVAGDSYDYIVIGNLLPKASLISTQRESSPGGYSYSNDIAAYYIDDIVVKPMENSITVKGDTLVPMGTTVLLTAYGSRNYKWADSLHPQTIIGNDDQLRYTMNEQKTFIVSGEGGQAQITVRILKPQEIILKELDGRKVKKGKTVEVEDNEVTITVYDKDEIDGDSVSIYYGDSCIVAGLPLTHKKKTYTIELSEFYPKQLILYAVNTGSKPPNTAAIIIKAGKETVPIVLSSDMKTCDSVLLLYKPKKHR